MEHRGLSGTVGIERNGSQQLLRASQRTDGGGDVRQGESPKMLCILRRKRA